MTGPVDLHAGPPEWGKQRFGFAISRGRSVGERATLRRFAHRASVSEARALISALSIKEDDFRLSCKAAKSVEITGQRCTRCRVDQCWL